jgi:ActR/RegA family two-component response regulator/PAS domain-containing protein
MSPSDVSARPAGRPPAPRVLPGPAALHALAAAFAHLQDFGGFVAGLQAALDQAEWFGRVTLEVGSGPGVAPSQFAIGDMILPLQGPAGAHGLMRVGGRGEEPRSFGPEDLHLLAGLADFLAAVLDRAHEWREGERRRQLFGLLLNQAPVGILAFDEHHRVLAGNDLARRWLGGSADPWAAVQAALPEELRAAAPAGRTCFHLRVDGRLVFGEVRTTPAGPGTGGVGVVVLTDLSPEQARLLDALRRETYRCQWRRLPLCFGLLDSPRIAGGLLQHLPVFRAGLPPTVAVGPYDANRVGLVFAERSRGAAAALLRRLGPLPGDAAVRAGFAELGREGGEPEKLLEAALGGLRPFSDAVRPALLLHDDDPAVNDALAYVLGRDFEVVKSTSVERTHELLRTRSFDALVTEVELRAASGLDLMRRAAELQPGIRPFFTTVSELPAAAAGDPRLAAAIVFQKPFDARALARTLREQLGVAEAPPAGGPAGAA